MEFQNLKAPDYAAIMALYRNPFAQVYCPRCGNRMKLVVKARFSSGENIYTIECTTPRCLFYPIPPTVTPECIRWRHPDEIKAAGAIPVRCSSSCCARDRCAVESRQEEIDV